MSSRVLTSLFKASYLTKGALGSSRSAILPLIGNVQYSSLTGHRSYCNHSNDDDQPKKPTESRIPGSLTSSYTPFKDRQRVVQDIVEEQWNPIEEEIKIPQPILYKRGKTGVFDLRELVQLLEEERALDICVIKLPAELDYADHMILVTSRSPRHLQALATFVRKRFKSKELKPTDRLPKIEGRKLNSDWLALDMGNIILHIFLPETRERMCLETLWTVGSQYDDLCNQKDSEIVQLLNMFQ